MRTKLIFHADPGDYIATNFRQALAFMLKVNVDKGEVVHNDRHYEIDLNMILLLIEEGKVPKRGGD